jgi:hypothetical protein
MKKIGEYTVRGSILDGGLSKIELFDGSFKTAYRVVEFTIFPEDPLVSTSDVSGVLMTENTGVPSPMWQAALNTQIAWSSVHMAGTAAAASPFEVIDPDNLIVEDLFIHINNTSSQSSNYFIRMEKYEISDWQGALAMVRAKAQNT